jgi:hypothetical protein
VGLPDPCRTRTRLVELADTTVGGLAQVIQAWRAYDTSNNGLVVSDMLAQLYRRDYPPTDPASVAMRAALENLVGCPPGKVPSPKQVGSRIRSFRRRVIEKHYLDTTPNEYNRNGAVWRLCAAKEGETNV